MYPEYEKINKLFNRCDELANTDKEFKDIFKFVFSFRKNNVGAIYYDDENKFRKKKYKAIEKDIYLKAPKIASIFKGNKNDTIVLKMANSVNWIECFYASLMAGYRVLLLDAKATKDGTINIINQVNAIGIISDDPFKYDVKKITNDDFIDLEKDKDFVPLWANEVIFCSSGTTGDVKLMVYNGANMVAQMTTCKGMPLSTKTIMYTKDMGKVNILAMIPFHHIFGFVAVFLWYFSWASSLVFPSSLAPSDIFSICQKVGITHVYSVPLFWDSLTKGLERKLATQDEENQQRIKNLIDVNLGKKDRKEVKHVDIIQKVVQKNLLGTKVKFCISGGGYLSQPTLETINGIGYPLYNGFGMTEVGVTSVELSADVKDRLKSSIGKPLYSVEYKIVEDKNNKGQGELLIKSPVTHVKEIIGGVEKEATIDKEGYFHTGDIVSKDEDNRFYIKGRIKDVIINANGENIFPDELELFFKDLEHVNHYSILGVKKGKGTDQKVVMVLEVDNSIKEEEIKVLIDTIKATKLPHGTVIEDIYFAKGKLPLANNMKVRRFKIKEAIEANSGEYIHFGENKKEKAQVNFDEKTTNEILIPIREIFSETLVLPMFKINDTDHWINDLGGDSMNYVEACQKINAKFGITIPEEDYGQMTCVNDFVLEVIKLKNKK